MSVTAATEKSTTPSSSEKVAPEHETALHRVSQSSLVLGSQHVPKRS
jgi:predicted secreted protein